MPAFDYDKLLWGERQIRSVANMTRQDARDFLTIAQELNIRPEVTSSRSPTPIRRCSLSKKKPKADPPLSSLEFPDLHGEPVNYLKRALFWYQSKGKILPWLPTWPVPFVTTCPMRKAGRR